MISFKKTHIILLLILISQVCFAQSVAWSKSLSWVKDEIINDAIETSNKNYIAVGYTSSKGLGGKDILVIECNKNGEIIWNKTFGGKNDDWANSIIPTNDSCYIIVGYSLSGENIKQTSYIIKIDKNGNKVWDKYIGGRYSEELLSISKSIKESYLITQNTISEITGKQNEYLNYIRLFRINNNGEIIWEKTFKKDYNLIASCVIEHNNSIYILANTINDILLIKTDKNGTLDWEKKLRGNKKDKAISALISNNTLSILGTTKSDGIGNNDIFLLNLDLDGNKLWSKSYGNKSNDTPGNFYLNKNGDYIVNSFKGKESYILKISSNGELISNNIINSNTCNTRGAIFEPNANEYLIANNVSNKNQGKDISFINITENDKASTNSSFTETSEIVLDVIEDTLIVKKKVNKRDTSDIPEYFALILGNEDYNREIKTTEKKNIKYAIKSAKDFKQSAYDDLKIKDDHIFSLYNFTEEKLTQTLDSINTIIDSIGGNTKLIVYYSGLAVYDRIDKDRFIVPVTENPNNDSIISIREYFGKLNKEFIISTYIFMDCYFENKTIADNPDKSIDKLTVFASGNKLAATYEKHQQRIFSYYLIESFKKNNGKIDYLDFTRNLSSELKVRTLMLYNDIQTPQVNGWIDGFIINTNIE